jgi:hypothetical protein
MKESMPSITRCEVKKCAYNNENNCHAFAINVGGPGDACPNCDTFFSAHSKGGHKNLIAGVGACKAETCKYNELFECVAPGVQVKLHESHADCVTFAAR